MGIIAGGVVAYKTKKATMIAQWRLCYALTSMSKGLVQQELQQTIQLMHKCRWIIQMPAFA